MLFVSHLAVQLNFPRVRQTFGNRGITVREPASLDEPASRKLAPGRKASVSRRCLLTPFSRLLAKNRYCSRIVASLDRKRLGADRWVEWGSQSEAFSMRRLGGSRWRLRRTRCAMGFERQSVAESNTGRTLVNWNGGVVIVENVRCL